jgi:hypothetical protein
VSCHVFDGANAHGGEREGYAEFFSRTGRFDFTIGVLHARQAHGCECDWHRHVFTHHGCGGGAIVDVARHALADPVFGESGGVLDKCGSGVAAGFTIVVEHARHAALIKFVKVGDGGGLF